MAIKVVNNPSPNILMNSLRSIGYQFKTALADIIDNSISASASNIYIYSPINEEDMFIAVLDDGCGMNDEELFNAMRYGSDRDFYGDKDLGRFGLGLKSASLSQCRILTVVSKKDEAISAYRWDLDEVSYDKEWNCLKLDDEEINLIHKIELLKQFSHGTLVVWENFDFGYKKSEGHLLEYLSNEIDDAEFHIRLVYHRFMSRKNMQTKIFLNDYCLKPIDPFLENNKKTDTSNPSEYNVDGSIITIQPFILPHESDLTKNDLEELGGLQSYKNGQGFYVYRNNRLIIYGTWFRLSSSNISSELYKYGRIKVDIPNTLDDTWEIDVKKQQAVIPKQILNSLKKVVNNVCNQSSNKIHKRAKLTLDKDDNKIWNKKLSSNAKDFYYINDESKFIKNFLDEFDDKDKVKILHLLEIVSSSLPYDDIYNSMCNGRKEDFLSDEIIDGIVLEGVSQFKNIKQQLCLPDEEVFNIIFKYEPFCRDIISTKIREVITNEKYK